jgi:predicted nucleotidyltransferase
MPTEALITTIEKARELLEADTRVAAAWLEGSVARYTADAWSDIDLNVAVHDEHYDEVLSERLLLLGQLAPVLGHFETRMPDGWLTAATLDALVRVDLLLFKVSDVTLRPRPATANAIRPSGYRRAVPPR